MGTQVILFFDCLFQYAYSTSPYYVGRRESQVTGYMNHSGDISSGYKTVDSEQAHWGAELLSIRAFLAAVDSEMP